jgi:hypothetical protein
LPHRRHTSTNVGSPTAIRTKGLVRVTARSHPRKCF